MRERQDKFSIYPLLKIMNIFLLMHKKLLYSRIVSSFPFSPPIKKQPSDRRDDISMYILEMKRICSVFRDIL